MTVIKTSISMQQSLFDEANEVARELNFSRSGLFTIALKDYLQRRRRQKMVEQLDRVYTEAPESEEEVVLRQIRGHARRLTEGEW